MSEERKKNWFGHECFLSRKDGDRVTIECICQQLIRLRLFEDGVLGRANERSIEDERLDVRRLR